MNGQVNNRSSRELWVVRKDDGPAIAYKLAPGHRSPEDVDADGFRAVDGTPVDGHIAWVKIIDLSTANVEDDGSSLTRGCLLCKDVGDQEFGDISYDDSPGWGELLG
ncbi:MAG: hypothetical protein ACFBSF_00560 [Leptolyngbyaceae cyanobacterium]